MSLRKSLGILAIGTAGLLVATTPAWAVHVPVALDVAALWPGPGQNGGYLEFINPTEHPALIGKPVPASPPGVIMTEEHTGYTLATGVDITEAGDGDVTHGDRADFDWVQEHRADESVGTSNHPSMVGAMGWTIGLTEASPHIDPGPGNAHGHSVAEAPPGALPELVLPDFAGTSFSAVDVFSIISTGLDTDADPTGAFSPRDAALDYELAFGNSVTGASSLGVPTIVWVPGWTAATGIDDFVARWVPAVAGIYDLIAIEPAAALGHDQVTEIDAVVAIPEPASLLLFAAGAAGLGLIGRPRRESVLRKDPGSRRD